MSRKNELEWMFNVRCEMCNVKGGMFNVVDAPIDFYGCKVSLY